MDPRVLPVIQYPQLLRGYVCALQQVLTLVPTAPSRLVSLISGAIPYRLRDRETQCIYLRGALALAEAPAAAAVREGILAAAAEHLLSLDVEIRWQDIAAAEAGASASRLLPQLSPASLCSQDAQSGNYMLAGMSLQ
jgi:hypothetical protein